MTFKRLYTALEATERIMDSWGQSWSCYHLKKLMHLLMMRQLMKMRINWDQLYFVMLLVLLIHTNTGFGNTDNASIDDATRESHDYDTDDETSQPSKENTPSSNNEKRNPFTKSSW